METFTPYNQIFFFEEHVLYIQYGFLCFKLTRPQLTVYITLLGDQEILGAYIDHRLHMREA
jgi:hypothetical protein